MVEAGSLAEAVEDPSRLGLGHGFRAQGFGFRSLCQLPAFSRKIQGASRAVSGASFAVACCRPAEPSTTSV